MRAVLEKGGKFAGINRKAQIKPLKWDQIKDAAGNLKEIVVEAQLILKWGGELTTAGKAQAEKFGHHFRNIYPGEDGLLRLHSTYRHDLKIYASDEGIFLFFFLKRIKNKKSIKIIIIILKGEFK